MRNTKSKAFEAYQYHGSLSIIQFLINETNIKIGDNMLWCYLLTENYYELFQVVFQEI